MQGQREERWRQRVSLLAGFGLGDGMLLSLRVPPIIGGRVTVPEADKKEQLRSDFAQALYESRAADVIERSDAVEGDHDGVGVDLGGQS